MLKTFFLDTSIMEEGVLKRGVSCVVLWDGCAQLSWGRVAKYNAVCWWGSRSCLRILGT